MLRDVVMKTPCINYTWVLNRAIRGNVQGTSSPRVSTFSLWLKAMFPKDVVLRLSSWCRGCSGRMLNGSLKKGREPYFIGMTFTISQTIIFGTEMFTTIISVYLAPCFKGFHTFLFFARELLHLRTSYKLEWTWTVRRGAGFLSIIAVKSWRASYQKQSVG